MHPDEALDILGNIYDEFKEFCSKRGQVTEADTRAQIIDRILKEVLQWPNSVIGREDPVHKGFIDYVLSLPSGRSVLVVEAKKEGVSFEMPISKGTIRYKLNGSARTNEELYNAINQAHYYAVEKGIRYAVVTNGYAWLVFRALRDDMPWRDGHAIAFTSAGNIKNNFTEFWNILSWEAITSGNYETNFLSVQPVKRNMFRVIDRLHNPDQLLSRNRLHIQLHPIVNRIFGDITDYDQVEILERCYIHTTTLRIVDRTLEFVIQDSIPHFATLEGTIDTTAGPTDGGKFGNEIEKVVSETDGSVFMLLGGVGSGKSTFLKRYFQFVGKKFIDSVGHWYYVGFLRPPVQSQLEDYVYEIILKQIRERYSRENLESRELILEAFNEEVERIHKTILEAEKLDAIEYQRRLSKYIEQWTADKGLYVKKLVSLLRKKGKAVVVCFDNVDQLSPDYQNAIFLLSQRIAAELKSIVIVALREETFYTATIQRTFTAYINQKFHVSSPDFRKLIGLRLKYTRNLLKLDDRKVRLIIKSGGSFDKQQVSDFLGIIEQSLLAYNKNISRFIECISSGNMRVALDLFTRFLYSGSTDVDKMLSIVSRSGAYYVPFHEFAKSVILGDRKYYRESEGLNEVLNVFDCGLERNGGHFTALRILNVLLDHRSVNSPEGRGYVKISSLLESFMVIFDNEEDFYRASDRLLRKNLIEVDTRVTDTIQKAVYIRITAAGWYYLTFLSKSFSYLDLIYVDTPLNSEDVCLQLLKLTRDVDSLPDEDRRQKLESRFERTRLFLNYLLIEERAERELFGLDKIGGGIGKTIIDPIISKCEEEIESIKRRLHTLFNPDEEELSPEVPEELAIKTDDAQETLGEQS